MPADRGSTGGAVVTAGAGRRLAMLIVLALNAGCARHLPVARPYPPPPATELAEALALRHRAVVSMNARARATSWLGGSRVRATVLMLVERVGRLRFEAEVSLQGTVAVLATDGRQFAFLDTMKNELRRGPACPANVASLIRIPLAPPDVAAILLGDARLPAGAAAAEGSVEWDGARAADVLSVGDGDERLRFLFQRPAGVARLVGAVSTGAAGVTRWRVAFQDFKDVTVPAAPAGGGSSTATTTVALPQTIQFAEGDSPFDEGVEIKFKERAMNEAVSDDAFLVRAPPNATLTQIGCAAAGAPNAGW